MGRNMSNKYYKNIILIISPYKLPFVRDNFNSTNKANSLHSYTTISVVQTGYLHTEAVPLIYICTSKKSTQL